MSKGLRDVDPRVREQVLILLEPSLHTPVPPPNLISAVSALTQDADSRVRLQAALAVGFVETDSVREPILDRLLARDSDHWVRLAAVSSSRSMSKARLAELLPRRTAPLRSAPQPQSPNPDRQRVVEQFLPALKLVGDRALGAVTIARLCLACHYLQGQGQRVGPDLSGSASRPVDALLTDLLDPNRQVAPDYTLYEATLADGESISGLFASETETRITLRRPGSPDENIPRSQLKGLRATGKSLMPDGLEAGLTVQDVADVLAFLQNPDGTLLPR